MMICKTREADKLTTWESEPTWKDFNEDYTNARASHDMFLVKLDEYRETLAGGKKINVRKGKSEVRPLLVRKHYEWKYSQLEEPFLSTENITKLKPKGPDDTRTYKQASSMINHYWAVDIDRIELVSDITRGLVQEGTVIVKNGWYTEKEQYQVQVQKPLYANAEQSLQMLHNLVGSGEMSEESAQAYIDSGTPMQIGEEVIVETKEKLIKNHPIHEVCDLEHTLIDPTCKNHLSSAQFIIHEYDTDYSVLIKDKFDPDTGVGYYKNLDSIDFKKDWEESDQYTTPSQATFIFADKARKKVRIKEYWGKWDIHGTGQTKPIVASWIGTTLVRLEENPFPHRKLPFSSTTYMPIKGQFHGEPEAALLKENQESIGKMTRAYHDITTTKAVGQKLVMEDTFSSQSEWSAFEIGNTARYRQGIDISRAIHTIGVEPVDNAIFQVIEMQQRDAESLTGTAAYNKGLGGNASSQATATGIKSASDSAGRRELSILRRMSSQLFRDMISQDIANMQVFASPEEVVRVTNEEYVTVKREDIQGNFDIVIDVSTPAKDAETAQTLSFIMQTIGDTVDPAVKNMLLGDIVRLKGRPDVAKQIEEFEPKPSEEQVKMQQMQMQNVELENKFLQMKIANLAKDMEDIDSKIAERDVKTNLVLPADAELNRAKGDEHEARSNYYSEMSDASAQKYLKEQTGMARREQIEDLVYNAEVKQEIEADKNKTALQNKVQGE